MKPYILLLFTLFSKTIFSQEEIKSAIPTRNMNASLTLTVPGIQGVNGSNGSSVCWNPANSKFYAAMAGNTGYAMAVFDKTGKCLSDTNATTLVDVRGMWYDKTKKQVCVNTYGNDGWHAYHLNAKGIPDKADRYYTGENQGGDNGVGVSDGSSKVYFMSEVEEKKAAIVQCDMKGEKRGEVYITLHGDLDEYDFEELYNTTSMAYTGLPGNEFALLNFYETQIELYSKNSGKCIQILKLPEEMELYDMFNFAYTNGLFFLFNKETREWKGFK